MRLIDADAVERSIWREWLCSRTTKEKELCDILEKIIDRCCEHIDNAPTINAEPVRHGYWKNYKFLDQCCSVCGNTPECEQGDTPPEYDYCPYCGAKMEYESSEL